MLELVLPGMVGILAGLSWVTYREVGRLWKHLAEALGILKEIEQDNIRLRKRVKCLEDYANGR